MATISANGSKGHHTFTLSVTEDSTSAVNNTSSLSFTFKISKYAGTYNWSSWGDSIKYSFIINGTSYSGTIPNYDGTSTVTLKSGSQTVEHNSDGTKSISISFSVTDNANQYYTCGNASQSGTMTLTTIPRQATVISAVSFNDEQNTSITFTNDGGFQLMPYINFYDGDGVMVYSINRTKGNYTSPYTFTITSVERTAMRNALNEQQIYECWCGVESYSGNTYIGYSSVKAYLTIVNASPTFTTMDYADTNTSVTAITLDSHNIVQGKSTVRVTYSPATANKGATISGYEITLNGVTRTSSIVENIDFGTINSAQNVSLSVSAIDSRGNRTTLTRTVTMSPYTTPTAIINLARVNNYEDSTKLKVDGSIASVDNKNVMTIQYKKKQVGGSYDSFITIQDNVEHTVTCDKNYEWVFYISVTDSFGGTYTTELQLPKGKFPLFIDTGKNAVGINEFPQSGESLRVADGISVFEDGIKIGTESVPDFVIEQGTSGSWTYRKWHSGILEQWVVLSPTFGSWYTWGNSYWYQSDAVTVNFGVSFLSGNQPLVNATNWSNSWAIPVTQDVNNSTFKLYGIRPTAGVTTANAYYFSLCAVGKWK